MKEILLQYAEYNVWANKLIIDTMLALEEGAVDKEVVSSFPSIRRTVLHTWSAESVWLQRLQQIAQPVWQEGVFKGSFAEACREWELASGGVVQLVTTHTDDSLKQEIAYHNRKDQPFTGTIYKALLHVCNHSTQHRGQLITMLRQVGCTKIPVTDYMAFGK